MHSFSTEKQKNLWLKRHEDYKTIYRKMTPLEKIVATLHFDVQDDGFRMGLVDCAKALGQKPKKISRIIKDLDSKMLRSLRDRVY